MNTLDILAVSLSVALSASSAEVDNAFIDIEESIEEVIVENTVENLFDSEDIGFNISEDWVATPTIVDLDFSTDVDDVVAVRMATSLDKLGRIELIGMALCTTGYNSIEALHGLLSYDGYADLPLGTAALDEPDESPYWDILAQYSNGNINRENAVRFYRRLLTNSDLKVNIITTGYTTNIAELLKSQPDDISPLNGIELCKEKVNCFYITGGDFPTGFDNNFFFTYHARNSIAYVLENSESPIVFNIKQNGSPIKAGGMLQRRDTNRQDPVVKALDAFGTGDGRASWDVISVWVTGYPLSETNFELARINVSINTENGFNSYEEVEDGKFYIVRRLNDNYSWYANKMDVLTTYDTPFWIDSVEE